MSTRSMIARKTENGIEAVYCHNEGGPAHHLPILTGSYATEEKAAALLDLGGLSVLGPELGEKHDFRTHGKTPETENWCLAYRRDRGDKDEVAAKRTYATEEEFLAAVSETWAEYVYLFRGGRWLYRARRGEAWSIANLPARAGA